jgi:hypothetical protein
VGQRRDQGVERGGVGQPGGGRLPGVGGDRRARRGPVKLPAATGYLSIYQRAVQPMSTGAVLVERAKD